MGTVVAFLRGMNLGGRRLTNVALAGAFTRLGFRDVAIYRASGNVLFDDEGGSLAALGPRIEEGLKTELGYDVPTFLRTADEVAAIAAFDGFGPAPVGKPQVTFLRGPPNAAARATVLALGTDEDRLVFGAARELYWLPHAGISQSSLDHAAIERAVGAGTTRTLGTVAALATRCAAR